VEYNNCVGFGVSDSVWNLPRDFKSNILYEKDRGFMIDGDTLAFWMRDSEFIMYKNNIELGKVGIKWSEKSSEKWYPVCFMYTQGTRVSYKITKK
jgi:hypothetical protein